jgi:hypothetical protein
MALSGSRSNFNAPRAYRLRRRPKVMLILGIVLLLLAGAAVAYTYTHKEAVPVAINLQRMYDQGNLEDEITTIDGLLKNNPPAQTFLLLSPKLSRRTAI